MTPAARPAAKELLARLAAGPVLADGAMGTMLYSLGVPYDRCFDELCLTQPDLVRRVHNDYLAAGAELIETNTFGANAFRLAEHGLGGRVREINAAGAALARGAGDRAARDVVVAGSVGPLGVTLAPVGAVDRRRAQAAYSAQVRALAEGGVDVILIETIPTLEEALIALAAAREACDLPVIVSLTFGEEGRTARGATPGEVAKALTAAGADVVGANCSTGPAPLLEAAARMAAATATPVTAMPNAGLPTVAGGRYIYTSSPAYMADVARDMVAAGVGIVGGCCGTTPEHVAAIGEALRSDGSPPERLAFPAPERVRAPARERLHRPTRFQAALGEGFAVTVEVDPPNGFDVGALLPKLRGLRDTGHIDAFNVADSPRAQARMSALAVAALLQGELGTDTVLHMACRHRNLVAVHSELLGAHALGVRNILVVMGDLPALGDYPDATAVRDITATGLMSLMSQFNRGVDAQGRALDDATAFHVGCAFSFAAPDPDRELKLLAKKIEAGASFALTQPVYDAAVVARFLDRLGGEFPVPLVLGVLPLWNARHAAFLHNEVPGIVVPDDVMARMTRAGDEGRLEGIAVAQEILSALQGVIRGAYFMPPFGRFEVVADVLDGLTLRRPVPAGEGGP